MWIPLHRVTEADELEQLLHALPSRAPLVLPDPQPELDVLLGRHVREQAVRLEDHPHVAPIRGDARDVLAVDDDRSGVRPVEAGDEAKRGRLPAPGRTEQRQELALVECDVDPVQRDDRPEGPPELVELEVRHQRVVATWAVRTRPRPTKRRASIAAQTIMKLSSDSAAASYGCVSLTIWI